MPAPGARAWPARRERAAGTESRDAPYTPSRPTRNKEEVETRTADLLEDTIIVYYNISS